MPTIEKLFTVEYGNKLDMNKQTPDPSGVCFIGRKGSEQGVSGRVRELPGVKKYPAGSLTTALGGSRLLATYVQQEPFYTAQNVAVLTPRDETMTLNERLYYAMAITANRYRYTAFGREANRTLRTISLPDEVPEWVSATPIPSRDWLAGSVGDSADLRPPNTWKEFVLTDLFELRRAAPLPRAKRRPGSTPYVSASAKNNGETDMCDAAPNFQAGCLTVAYDGSIGEAFYQDRPFVLGEKVCALVPKLPISKWAQLFIATVIRHERFRYTYGYKWNTVRMQRTILKLPATVKGDPDWAEMERFMRGLPFSTACNL